MWRRVTEALSASVGASSGPTVGVTWAASTSRNYASCTEIYNNNYVYCKHLQRAMHPGKNLLRNL